jgi:hypothetical protein
MNSSGILGAMLSIRVPFYHRDALFAGGFKY